MDAWGRIRACHRCFPMPGSETYSNLQNVMSKPWLRLTMPAAFLLRYILLLGCILATLYFGVWGPSFGAAAFVYMQF